MANIEKRGDTYRIRVFAGKTADGKLIYQRMTYKPTAKSEKAREKEVQKQAALFEEKVKSGAVIPSKITFSKFYQTWLTDGAADHLTERTRQDYCANIKKYGVSVFGNIEIGKINAITCQKLIKHLSATLAPATVRKIVASLDAVFNHAYKMQMIPENPFRRCDLPKMKRQRPDDLHYFTAEQTRRFLQAIGEPYSTVYTRYGKIFTESHTMSLQLQCFFNLAIYGGFRRGELLALTWEDIDFQSHTININKAMSEVRTEKKSKWKQVTKGPKTESSRRSIEVPMHCFTLLARWKAEERKIMLLLDSSWQGPDIWHFDSNFVFVQMDTGRQMCSSTPYLAFKRFIERYNESVEDPKTKLPEIRLHDLRHTTATLLLAEGTDIETVSKRLGHSKASTTLDIYGHATQDKDREASETLSRLLG